MPGGRLSHEDRQSIAAWLSDGLNYAEIARRLGRPRSTITREVTRNGGPDGYAPDPAQHATQQRASRSRSLRPPAPPTTADLNGRDPDAVREFEERFTEMLVLNGLPSMMARILACLYTTDAGSLTAAELTQRLRVSPASISTAVRTLEQQGHVTRERDTHGRRDRYVIGNDVWYQAMLASARSNSLLAETAREGARTFGTDTAAGARLKEVGLFLEHVYVDLIRAAEHWREVYSARQSDH